MWSKQGVFWYKFFSITPIPRADPEFWSAEFWPQRGGPEPNICSKQGFPPLKLPENCMILKRILRARGAGPQGALDPPVHDISRTQHKHFALFRPCCKNLARFLNFNYSTEYSTLRGTRFWVITFAIYRATLYETCHSWAPLSLPVSSAMFRIRLLRYLLLSTRLILTRKELWKNLHLFSFSRC